VPALQGKVCLVTGASSGIGLAVAQRFAREGARLCLVSRAVGKLATAAASLDPGAPTPLIVPADLTSSGDIRRVVERATAELGGIDVLVNAAGSAYFLPVGETTEAQWDEILDVNLKAVFLMCHHVVPRMLEAGRGDIVNVGSIASHIGLGNSTAYTASKHGLLGFSKALAAEVRREGLRVITVSPGSVNTPLWDGMEWTPEKSRMLLPEDVAEAVHAALTMSDNATVDEMVVMPRDGVL
jgi:NAD(P)-dependent dehydrogenase (short-subunit alcohol dehydrogenase family)